ncbi:alpha-N-acetyl-neuraminyl-2,3-beta-galactosyl-1,3-N-acetyl-galactosaminide alpha-2,6-sialyltransferase-like [Anneissia japonica]|uniref:alpha-N-acetyl-neuraminyl-2,3-beta-galactosyl-1, 3-N-acetyl-galactosaminide alpha-2,6-sialyltransferase-like n=1 Tax=Anneissia japonica TaxID=1529436 RepID=UPI001425881F|nr:alpha-N-acetyl-neuraminyl-2,3-beta-galactosyl-1,3-N-acetyl-galactosaminide alpha-2,6-sialyltransferase-like [Anneissia japonica]XP_033103685.1 alpha-N-acetyl-neuraminyl-2,3-beta-galactosyl-1,3-N-acetyl-galactosaminide alpha-2,6-sialyltransferase-like [Anneissia japonica]XP_033103686.1 alpha-N-acetyl-neuraminyl-2,3-beta-galactosyl-1,3-N-acetyl-galactosaminide alpha-2,6-sialyltransferase-like [Anneissia japonica]XP_033103687.1 alpha-N-acetyl-neuraminyl-2,3-beta-galactosyl-1,3-N-acetyl-galactosa
MKKWSTMCIFIMVVFSILNTFLLYQYAKSDDKVRPHRSFGFDKLFAFSSGMKQINTADIQAVRRLQGDAVYSFSSEYLPNMPLNKLSATKLIMETAEMYTDLYKTKILDRKCNTCAVVTSSGRLLNQSAGSKIDQSDCVIRMNNAPVAGYEDDVGARTDIRIVGNVNSKFLQNHSEVLFQPPRKNAKNRPVIILTWLYNATVNMTGPEMIVAKNLSKYFPRFQFYIPTKFAFLVVEDIFRFETGFQRSKLNTWFTTGWQTMLLSMSICNEVHIYGMPQYELCRESDPTLYHYYDKQGLKECEYYKKSEINPDTGHLFITEKAIFARWAKRYNNIHFHYPSWNLSSVDDINLNSPFIRELRLVTLRDIELLRKQAIPQRHYKVPKEPLYLILFTFSLIFILVQGLKFVKLLIQMFDVRKNTW